MTNTKTNSERLDDFLSYGSPMNQAFLIEAVCRYADEILSDEAEVRKQMEDSFISPESWISAAKSAREHFDPDHFK